VADGGTLPEAWRRLAFEQLADHSHDGVWACDDKLRCLYWNAAMERISGLPAARALGHGAALLLSQVTGADQEPQIRRSLAGQPSASRERTLPAQGEDPGLIVQIHHLPIRDEAGQVVAAAGIVRDVSEERRILRDLQETDARFRNMADAAPVLLWMSRTDGLCTFFNQTWLEFTGRTLDEEWGVGWAENVHFEDLASCLDTYTRAFNERRVFEMEYRLRRHDGEYRWILDRGTPRYTPEGSFAGYIGSCVDITERRKLEGVLRGAVEARDDFLSVASHELGTPLTALRLHVERLQRSLRPGASMPDAATITERVALIHEQVGRLAGLVETLLDTTRLAAGGWRLTLERVDLGELVARVVQRLTPMADKARCPVTLESRPALTGRWDPGRLEQAVTNLLSNAFKYGAGKPVEVTVATDGPTASVRVRDYGIGLEPDQHAVIFERFGRAVPTRKYGGLGLGLWIARQAVQAMGGTIRVQGVAGEGSTFELVLPRDASGVMARGAG
jgi:PAS domain S-box-containing protein